jgi:hypothetical protein
MNHLLATTGTTKAAEFQSMVGAIAVAAVMLLGFGYLGVAAWLHVRRERRAGLLARSIGQRLRDAWRSFFGAVARLEAESEVSDRSLDGRVIGVVTLSCVMLSFLEYYGSSSDYVILEKPLGLFVDEPGKLLTQYFRRGPRAELFRLSYWSFGTFVGYFLVPALFVKLVLRERIRDYGLKLEGLLSHTWIYVAMFMIVLPAVWFVSHTEGFQRMYPFYDNAHLSALDFVAWTLVYGLQFFSLEFFFRGFMIHGTKHRFGYYAILVSVVPYCMIHFGKPLPETIGAIIAGLALGTLSLMSRSIWLGVFIHVSVAVSMDLLSLAAQGKF